MYRSSLLVAAALLGIVTISCSELGDDAATPATSPAPQVEVAPPTIPATPWTEENITFPVGPHVLSGVITLPSSAGPHSAVVITSGSESQDGTIQSGVSALFFVELARGLAEEGYVTLRYDTVGVGQSEGEAGFQTLEAKRDQALAALRFAQEHPAVRADEVGLWGISQEAWIIGMAAAREPDDVAFVIAVSGAGISVADQQVWGVESQSRAAGLDPSDVDRATLFAGLFVDWQLTEPRFEETNRQLLATLGEGPWQDFAELVYESDAADELDRTIEILESVRDEPWADALYLDEIYLPQLRSIRSIPADQVDLVRTAVEQTLLTDPADHLRHVTSPVLAIFGEDDIVQPTARSAELYATYLEDAGNDDVTIVVLPEVGHDISLATPGYRDQLVAWLDAR